MKDNLPTLMLETDTDNAVVVYVNGVPIPGIVDVSLESDRTFGYARCRLEFFCRVATGLTTEQKEKTKQGLRELLASLES